VAWLLYYERNFQTVIKPKVEKRVRELKVEVILRIRGEQIRISGNPVEGQEQHKVKDAGHQIQAKQDISQCWLEHAVKVCTFYILLTQLTPSSLVFPRPQ
jgi:hypothetical protein